MKIVSLFVLLFTVLSCSTAPKSTDTTTSSPSAPSEQTKPGTVPTAAEVQAASAAMKLSPKSEILLDHKYFKVSYNEDHKLPNWVSYSLSAKNLRKGVAKRRDKFFSDVTLMKMQIPYAKPTDFDGKVYDRGHLAPSEDFVWSQEANDETFVMTNMAPQKKRLNRGAWKSLETKVRNWACTEEQVTVITGPVLNKIPKRAPSAVSIPQKFFKVVIDETPPRKAIGFVFEQDDGKFDMAKKATSLAEVEKLAGIHFASESGLTKAEYAKLRNSFKAEDWVEGDCVRKVANDGN